MIMYSFSKQFLLFSSHFFAASTCLQRRSQSDKHLKGECFIVELNELICSAEASPSQENFNSQCPNSSHILFRFSDIDTLLAYKISLFPVR